ncbi:MAG: PAS domain S-box protein [Bdellovibrionales bacterium]
MKNTVETLPAVFYAKDVNGRYIMVNNFFKQLMGWDESYIVGKSDTDLLLKPMPSGLNSVILK